MSISSNTHPPADRRRSARVGYANRGRLETMAVQQRVKPVSLVVTKLLDLVAEELEIVRWVRRIPRGFGHLCQVVLELVGRPAVNSLLLS